MKELIEKKIIQSKDTLKHLSKCIFNNESDSVKTFSQIFNNYNLHVNKIPYKDVTAFTVSSKHLDGRPKIIFPMILKNNNYLINRWRDSITLPIIMGAFICLHCLGDKLHGELIAIGLPGEHFLDKDGIRTHFKGSNLCIFVHADDKTRESGSSMAYKVIDIEFEGSVLDQSEDSLHFSNPIDAQTSFIHTLNMIKLSISEEIFINYSINVEQANIFSKPKKTFISIALSSSVDYLVDDMVLMLENMVYHTSKMFKVKGTTKILTTLYEKFQNNDALNRIFCHNLKEKGFVDILSHQNKNILVPVSQISHMTPSIFPSIGLNNIGIKNDIELKKTNTISNESMDTILNGAMVYANTIYDVISQPKLLKEINKIFDDLH